VHDTITTIEQTAANPLVSKIKTALLRAVGGDGELPEAILAMEGMSGRKYRIFINNLIKSLDDARYLEVGVLMGSTLCSAIYGNNVRALAVDNWSQFGAPSTQFFANLANFKTPEAQISFIEADFRAIDISAVGRFNVYLFDGPHEQEDHYNGVVGMQAALDHHHVVIVDDWNCPEVRKGTLDAIKDAELTIDHLIEIRTTHDNQHASIGGAQSDWHNGYLIAAVTKRTSTAIAQ
jgi:hypothetical protein